MKKILLAAVALVICGSAMAIDNEPKQGATFMGFLGMNTTHITNTTFDNKVGGTMGARVDYVLPKAHGTYLTTGIDWNLKGGKITDTREILGHSLTATTKCALHYIEIPVRAGFRYNLNREIGFYGEAGPYFAVGVGGKYKYKIDADGTEYRQEETDYPVFKDKDSRLNWQRWDCGVGFRVGAEYNQHYNLMLGCDWGITDMYRDNYRDVNAQLGLGRAHNFNFTIAFGYRF